MSAVEIICRARALLARLGRHDFVHIHSLAERFEHSATYVGLGLDKFGVCCANDGLLECQTFWNHDHRW